MARRVRDRADTAGSRCCTPPWTMARLAPTQMNAPSRPPQITSTRSGSRPSSGATRNGTPTRTTHGDDPAQPARDDRARVAAAGGPPDRRGHDPATVQREPREQVEHAHDQVAQHQGPRPAGGRRCPGRAAHRPRTPAPASSSETSGPATAIPASRPGVSGRPLDLGHAAQQVQADPPDRQPGPQRDDRVAELVHQHGDVEQHREGQRHGVPPQARARAPRARRRRRTRR